MSVTVELINASGERDVPTRRDFQFWSSTAMARICPSTSALGLSIRVVDEAESARLNQTWRRGQGATNILSFPVAGALPPQHAALLGDLAICAPVVRRQAGEQHKNPRAHWAHMTVHGVLHLSGYDHETPAQAREMEALERAILQQMGFADPYQCP